MVGNSRSKPSVLLYFERLTPPLQQAPLLCLVIFRQFNKIDSCQRQPSFTAELSDDKKLLKQKSSSFQNCFPIVGLQMVRINQKFLADLKKIANLAINLKEYNSIYSEQMIKNDHPQQ